MKTSLRPSCLLAVLLFAAAGAHAQADLAISKSTSLHFIPGTNVTYYVLVSNSGPSAAENVVWTDPPSPDLTFVSMRQFSGPAFTCDAPGGSITCSIASLAPSAMAEFELVFASSPAGTIIDNTAFISSSTPDPDSGNNSSTDEALAVFVFDTSIVKSGPATAAAGTNVTYTLTAANAGPSNASSVTLTDLVPSNVTLVSFMQNSGPTFICNNEVVCTLATFPAGATATFTAVFSVPSNATGSVTNTATIRTPPIFGDPTANGSSTATTVIDRGPTDLSITKTAGTGRYGFGAPITYTITVRNDGPWAAVDATVTDVIPPNTTFQSATPSQGGCTGSTTVVCNLGTLAPAATATITLVVRAPSAAAEIANTASVSAANVETDPGDNSGTAATHVTGEIPALSTYALIAMAVLLGIMGVMRRVS